MTRSKLSLIHPLNLTALEAAENDEDFDGEIDEERGENEPVQMPEPKPFVVEESDPDDEPSKPAEVVSLDSFRK